MEFQLINHNWSWFHRDNYEWEYIPNCDNLEDSETLFLKDRPNSNLIKSKPLEKFLFFCKSSPCKEDEILFQKFINLDGSPESFINFANECGYLAIEKTVLSNNGKKEITTSSLGFWIFQHWLFNITYKIWVALSSPIDKEKELSKIITVSHGERNGEKVIHLSLLDKENIPAGNDVRSHDTLPLFLFKDSDFPGLKITLVNNIPVGIGIGFKETNMHGKTLYDAGQFFLFWLVNGQMKLYPTLAQLKYDNGKLSQTFLPQNLLAAMWFQFFQVITGERIIKQCTICGKWSDITDEKKGKEPWSKHRNCANWDRVTKSRKFAAAKKLINDGKTITETANILKVTERDINRWLSEDK